MVNSVFPMMRDGPKKSQRGDRYTPSPPPLPPWPKEKKDRILIKNLRSTALNLVSIQRSGETRKWKALDNNDLNQVVASSGF